MFESLTSTSTLLKLAGEGNLSRLQSLAAKGCEIGKRQYGEYFSPLDYAVKQRHANCVEFLLEIGVQLGGTAILHALDNDYVEALEIFYKNFPDFYTRFCRGSNGQGNNPYLNRWQLNLNALDYSIHKESANCTDFLFQIGMKKRRHIVCKMGHYAPWIQDSAWVVIGGFNIDGRSIVTEGFYCPTCERFVK